MRTLLLAGYLLLSACQLVGPDEGNGPRKATLDRPFTLQAEETAVFSDSLEFHLLQLNDSRCPLDVSCVWSGEVELVYSLGNPRAFAVSVPDTIRGYLSRNGNDVLRDTTSSYLVTVKHVWPYPRTEHARPSSRARLVVSPLER